MHGKSKSKCSFSNVAGRGSGHHDFYTTERAIFDSSEFNVGEKVPSSQLVAKIHREEKEFGNFWRSRYASDKDYFIFEKCDKCISEIFSRGAGWENFSAFLWRRCSIERNTVLLSLPASEIRLE